MKTVFVDTSAFFAVLDGTDPFHSEALGAFQRAANENWQLVTTNYVVHETWALIQNRLGWEGVEAFLDRLLPRCRTIWVDERLYTLGAARCRQMRLRRLSLTDCISFECMKQRGIREGIARDEHFERERISFP